MPQKQFTNYNANILSFDLREAMLGIINPGRYIGYNVLTTNGSPSAGSIPLKLQHTGGVKKLPKGSTSLANPVGVAVSTQGTIIHEDQEVTFTITDNSAGESEKFALVYMEHSYVDGVAGDNPATYGVIVGTSGGGVPTLTNAYKRCIIGVVRLEPGAISILGATWQPRPSDSGLGDTRLFKKLFGNNSEFISTLVGTIPSDGIIGTRLYTENNYLEDEESITSSLDILDMILKDVDDLSAEINIRPLDSENWEPLTDITYGNADTTKHGFLPKLEGSPSKYLNAQGAWTTPPVGMMASDNLAGLTNVALARTNLGGVLTNSEIQNNYFADTGWQNMAVGSSVPSADFTMKVRKRGKIVCITGKFKLSANPSSDETLFSIPKTLIGNDAVPSNRVTTQVQYISDAQNNRGIQLYVDTSTISTNLEVKAGLNIYAALNEVLWVTITYIAG